jgi:heme oxygenase
MTFSKELKIGTKKSHSAAENTTFVASFLRGVVSKESYKKLVSDLYFVYSAMEEEVEKLKDHPIIGQLQLSDLNRVNALEQDLRFYYGPIWRSLIKPSEACNQYVNRIREVAKNEPELLVGHHYTRYLGDLSGGQILKGIAEKALALGDGQGLKFYDFEKIEDTKAYKAGYRGILDGLPITEHQANAIIVEANYAFRLNMYMFDTLEGNWIQSLLQMIISFIKGLFK